MKSQNLKMLQVVLLCMLGLGLSDRLEASSFAAGLNGGMELPFWHTEDQDPGPVGEAYWRIDPYEVRFHYHYTKVHYYSVLLGIKHFFSNDTLRPFVEVAGGPLIVNTPSEGLAYGLQPVASLGAELGVNENFSTLVAARYAGAIYFGDTSSGSWEATHGLSIVAGVALWF